MGLLITDTTVIFFRRLTCRRVASVSGGAFPSCSTVTTSCMFTPPCDRTKKEQADCQQVQYRIYATREEAILGINFKDRWPSREVQQATRLLPHRNLQPVFRIQIHCIRVRIQALLNRVRIQSRSRQRFLWGKKFDKMRIRIRNRFRIDLKCWILIRIETAA
jgi:hypothetical protein